MAALISEISRICADLDEVVEADLGIEVGEALESQRAAASAKRRYFRIKDVPTWTPPGR